MEGESFFLVDIIEFGDSDVLNLTKHDTLPVPQSGQVRIKVISTTASFTDVMVRRGMYVGVKEKPPFAPGYDLVGEIAALGEGVSDFKVGDVVAALTVWGAYTQQIVLSTQYLVKVPENTDPHKAVSLVLAYTTAYQMLHRTIASQTPLSSILVHGASGSVGAALVTLAKLHGVETIYATCNRTSHGSFVESLGATHVIDYRHDDFVSVVEAHGSVDVAFDAIGLDNFKRSYLCLKDTGCLITYGYYNTSLGGTKMGLAAEFVSHKAWTLWKSMWNDKREQFYNITELREQHPDWFRQDVLALLDMLAQGRIDPLVFRVMSLEQASEAHELIEQHKVHGKIVLDVNMQ